MPPPLVGIYPNPLRGILDPPQEIPLENAGNGICKTLDFRSLAYVGPSAPIAIYFQNITVFFKSY